MKLVAAFVVSMVAAGSLAPAAHAFETRTIDMGAGDGAHYVEPEKQTQPTTSKRQNFNGTETTTTTRSMGPLNFSTSFTGRERGLPSDPATFPSSGFTTGQDLMPRR